MNDPDASGAHGIERLEALFFAALEQPADRRAEFLDRVCGAEPALRAAVERMLRADGDRGGVIDDDS